MRLEEAKGMQCTHRFQVDNNNTGTCSECGEVRQFPWDKGGEIAILKKGSPNNSLPHGNKSNKRGRKTMKHNRQSQIRERHTHYEQNKEAIVADLLSKGRKATCHKWNIPSSSLCSIEKRWLTKEQKLKIPTPVITSESPRPSTNTTTSNGRLPPFPQFSDTWDPSVQLEWLDVYRMLATREKSTVATTS